MKIFRKHASLRHLVSTDDGLSSVEYAIMAGLAVLIIGAVTAGFSDRVEETFSQTGDQIGIALSGENESASAGTEQPARGSNESTTGDASF